MGSAIGLWSIFTTRRYAKRGTCRRRMSVYTDKCIAQSLCHSRASCIVKNEGVFTVIVSHIHFKSGSISGMELDRDTVTWPM